MPSQVKSAPSVQSIVQSFFVLQSAESAGSHTPGWDNPIVCDGAVPVLWKKTNNGHAYIFLYTSAYNLEFELKM